MTVRSRIFARLVMTSSCTPSAKNSFSFSELRLANGRTAMDFSPSAEAAGVDGVGAEAVFVSAADFDSGVDSFAAGRKGTEATSASTAVPKATRSHLGKPDECGVAATGADEVKEACEPAARALGAALRGASSRRLTCSTNCGEGRPRGNRVHW